MLSQYNIKAGILFALTIAMLTTVLPRIIRLDLDQPYIVVANFIYLFVTFLFYWLTHHFFLLHLRLGFFARRLPKAVVSILCSVAMIGFLAWWLNIASPFPLFRNTDAPVIPRQALPIRLFRGLIVSALTWFAVFYYRLLLMLQQSRLENEYLKQENLQAQLASLRQQISPHFLFNSLNTLSTLSHEGLVKEYILKLSAVYRYVLHYQEQSIVPVREELDFIRSYVYILQSRFEEGLTVNIRLNPECFDRKILPFALQLLVENAVKHNAISYTNPLAIDIYDGDGCLIVENDIRPRMTMTMDSSYSTGLHNLAKRYRLTAGKEITIFRDNCKFKVQIPFLV